MSSEEENKSCFTLDGVVAEMDIEVEDSHAHGFDDLGDSAIVSEKISGTVKEDKTDSGTNQLNVEDISSSEDYKTEIKVEPMSLDSSVENVEGKQPETEKKKLKRNRLSVSDDEENEKNVQDHRYPGRKRQANKKYISEDLVTGMRSRSNSLQTNPISNKAKPKIQGTSSETEESNKKQETLKEKKRKDTFDSDDAVSDEGKLPWRKNKDAPESPESDSEVLCNGNGKGQGHCLGSLRGIRERIRSSKSVRPLFRVLFFQWPTNNIDLVGEIFKFNGFPFDETSYEFTKRQNMMKIMLDVTISHIATILGLKSGPKKDMINDILNFLMKPHGKIYFEEDSPMQPIVLLERIVLDSKFIAQAMDYYRMKEEASKLKSSKPKETVLAETPVRSTRHTTVKKSEPEEPITTKKKPGPKPGFKKSSVSVTSSKNIKSDDKRDTSKGSKDKFKVIEKPKSAEKGKVQVKGKLQTKTKSEEKSKELSKVEETPEEPVKAKVEEKPKVAEKSKLPEKSKVQVKTKPKSQEKPKTSEKKNIPVKGKTEEKSEMDKKSAGEESLEDVSLSESLSSDSETDISKIKKKIELLKKKIKKKKSLKKSRNEELKSNEKEGEVEVDEKKKETDKQKKRSKQQNADPAAILDSSETESSDEAKLAFVSPSPRKLIKKARIGKPLKNFPKIVESIQKASFSALQRLHILLFGASDKAENLKSNILAFGGFPFLEGSEDWKQKHFLLSLLAQNNLKEYLNLMCIESNEEDQTSMINKLMKFLAAPIENSEISAPSPPTPVIETEVISSELVNKSPLSASVKSKAAGNSKNKAKKAKKEEKKKVGPRNRKVLMSEEEARKMEASFAREQRALARDNKSTPFSKTGVGTLTPVSSAVNVPKKSHALDPVNPNQLHALLQTVYKRRALKQAGAVISTPNKGQRTKLGDIENIKFLIVTSNLRDLELLHRLIFMLDSSKSRVRKNILDFNGFYFTEESPKYAERMDFLNELGYDVSKRLSFLLGLCPLHTNIPQQDLNELIMYFLMSPTKTKEVVPITQMPTDSGYVATVEKNRVILKPTNAFETAPFENVLKVVPPPSFNASNFSSLNFEASTPISQNVQRKARKSFSSSAIASPIQKVVLPPSLRESVVSSGVKIGGFHSKMHDTPSLSPSAYITGTTKPVLQVGNRVATVSAAKAQTGYPLLKLPVANSGVNLQLINSGSNVAVLDTIRKDNPNISLPKFVPQPHMPQEPRAVLKPQVSAKPEEFIVQQQTPDGKQKTFKLIRLPANHPLASVVKPSVQNPTPVMMQNKSPMTTVSASLPTHLPPGFIIMKNNPQQILAVPNLPLKIKEPERMAVNIEHSPEVSEEFVLPDEGYSGNSSMNDLEIEILNPMEENPPTDDELFSSIQDLILSSNFEDITLRNVIERVAAQFPGQDLTPRHNFMKECVKKIIIGT